jgi:hypothetical protein
MLWQHGIKSNQIFYFSNPLNVSNPFLHFDCSHNPPEKLVKGVELGRLTAANAILATRHDVEGLETAIESHASKEHAVVGEGHCEGMAH